MVKDFKLATRKTFTSAHNVVNTYALVARLAKTTERPGVDIHGVFDTCSDSESTYIFYTFLCFM